MVQGKLKVAHVVATFAGGARTYMCHVLPRLVARGYDITLIVSLDRDCPDAPEGLRQLAQQGVHVRILSMTRRIRPVRDLRAFVALLRLLRHGRFDIVHTHCSKAGALGRVAATIVGHPARIHSPHCFAFLRCGTPWQRQLYLVVEKILGRFTTVLAAVGPAEARAALDYRIVPPGRCVSVGNGLAGLARTRVQPGSPAHRACASKLRIPEGAHVVSTVCRLVDYKGVLRFIEAAEISRRSDCIFLVVGDGRMRIYGEKYVQEHALGDKVRFVGHVSNAQEIYDLSDVVVLCSDAEAMPYTLLEAMRARCPIVATAVPGNKELIRHNRTGYLVVPEPMQLAAAIDDALRDWENSRRLAEQAHDCFRREHSLDRQIEQIVAVYENAL